MTYDLAKQYQALVTSYRAALKVVEAARRVTKAPRMYRSEDKDLVAALAEWDATPKAVLDHQPDPPHPASKER